jgi:PD-(D/E)XK nuclease superfamily
MMLKQEGYDLMGAAFEVYNVLGYGMAEEIGRELITKYQPDLLLFGQIIVELKAVKALAPEHEAQLFNYLRISKKQVG